MTKQTVDTPTKSLSLKALALKHLQVHSRRLNRLLRSAVKQQHHIAEGLLRKDITPLCVSDDQVEQLLDHTQDQLIFHYALDYANSLSKGEAELEKQIRLKAAECDYQLPLDTLTHTFRLNSFERDCILLCVLTKMHRAYDRIFAYLHDDLNKQQPSLQLLCSLLSSEEHLWADNYHALSPHARLRRYGLLQVEAAEKSNAYLPMNVSNALVVALNTPLQAEHAERFWHQNYYDIHEVRLTDTHLTTLSECDELKQFSKQLLNNTLSTLAIWSEHGRDIEPAVHAVAHEAHLPLWRLPQSSNDIQTIFDCVKANQGLLWVDLDGFEDQEGQPSTSQLQHLLQLLTLGSCRVILSGSRPWRPTELLAGHTYAEVRLSFTETDHRLRFWEQAFPALEKEAVRQLADKYQLDIQEILAVQTVHAAKHGAEFSGDLRVATPLTLGVQDVDDACRLVTQKKHSKFSRFSYPKRQADELILPAQVYKQVLEVPTFFQQLKTVNRQWGFSASSTSEGGLKALFTGDSGTGKTLAAEVIASLIQLPLMKIDLSQLVSKWVGETEKNIDAAFAEAEASHTMLMFDEAESIFGRRGEIQQGSDRYANLEVGYLLQRVEQFKGIVVLASNLKDEIDEAFIRRFQIILHFPRPQMDERLRLWKNAFPPSAPLEKGMDFSALVHLDMTGAGISNAAHTAALLAASEGSPTITSQHIIEGISRQYHRESRILSPQELQAFNHAPRRLHNMVGNF